MKIARKSLALLMVCALMLTTLGAVASFAASVDELVIEMVDGQLVVMKNGEVFKTFDADAQEGIKLSRSAKTDKIVITFTDANGKTRNVALADDATISIEGTMGSVTLNKTLGDVAVNVAQTATVDTLSIKNSGAVEVAGTVKDVNVTTKAANISVTDTAKVDTVSVPKGVEVTGAGAANVGSTTVKEDPKPATPPVAPPPISGGGDYNWQDMNPSPSLPGPSVPHGFLVKTEQELLTALSGSEPVIALGADINLTKGLRIGRAVTINGGGRTLNVANGVYSDVQDKSAIYITVSNVTIDNVRVVISEACATNAMGKPGSVNGVMIVNDVNGVAQPGSLTNVNLRNNVISATNTAPGNPKSYGIYSSSGAVSIIGNTVIGSYGIGLEGATATARPTISGNAINCNGGFSLYVDGAAGWFPATLDAAFGTATGGYSKLNAASKPIIDAYIAQLTGTTNTLVVWVDQIAEKYTISGGTVTASAYYSSKTWIPIS